MTELSFLIDLLLNEKLSKSVKDKISVRVKEVEETIHVAPPVRAQQSLPPPRVINGAVQSPSTVAAMERQADGYAPPINVVVASPAAAQAMMNRNAALNEAINSTHNSKPPAGRTSPKKW